MKTCLMSLLLSIMSSLSSAQINLVTNGSFEDTVACPQGIGEISCALGWSSFSRTPDYLNACNTSTTGTSYAGVPANLFGYQYAKTGNAYVGVYSYARFGTDYREVVGSQLISNLVVGNSYFIQFFVSRGFNLSPGHINIESNKLGVRFSTVSYNDTNPIPIDNFAHIFSDSIISDTSNWIQISGFFVADSAYQFISIGNFFNDSATTFNLLDSSASFAYYYIDDVKVIDSTLTYINQIADIEEILLFPNPFYDKLNLNINDFKSIIIFDATGRKCIRYTSSSTIKSIDLRSLSKGIYFIRICTSKDIFFKKIIKQ